MRSPGPCSSHHPYGPERPHVSDHRRPTSSSSGLLASANSAALSLGHHMSIDLLAIVPTRKRRHSGVQGPLSAPIWITQRSRISCVCPPRLLLSSDGLVIQLVSSVLLWRSTLRATVATAKHTTQKNPDGEHVALCSTPQGTTIQNRLSTHGSAATCSGIRAVQPDSLNNQYCTKSRQTSFSTVVGGKEERSR